MNREEDLGLPPEIQAELQAIQDLMVERQASTQAAIDAHSQAWKDLESNPSHEAAEALLRAEALSLRVTLVFHPSEGFIP
jgi:hypothetical protein